MSKDDETGDCHDSQTLKEFFQQTPDDWETRLISLISSVVRKELDNSPHKCRIDMNDMEIKQLEHCGGMMRDLGGGGKDGMSVGIEIIRDNHKWLQQQRERGSKIQTAFFIAIAMSMTAGTFTALWLGVKTMVGVK